MKRITSAMRAHLQQEVTTLCTCWQITLRGGKYKDNNKLLAFTDHTRDLVVNGVTHKTAASYASTAVESSCLLNVDTIEARLILDPAYVSEKDLLAGVWDDAEIEIFWVNYEDVAMGTIHRKSGTAGQITIEGGSFVLEVRSLTQVYANLIGELYSPLCRATLGDERCGVDMAAYTFSGVVESVDATNRIITDSSLTQSGPADPITITNISRAEDAIVTAPGHPFEHGSMVFITGVQGVVQMGATDAEGEYQAGSGISINNRTYYIGEVTADTFSIDVDTRFASDNPDVGPEYSLQYSAYLGGGQAVAQDNVGYFDYGTVTFLTGRNAGYSMEVKSYITGVVELQLPLPYPIERGDQYQIKAGCAQRFIEDCKDRFNNVVNFRGEPDLPGLDQTLKVSNSPSAPNPNSMGEDGGGEVIY